MKWFNQIGNWSEVLTQKELDFAKRLEKDFYPNVFMSDHDEQYIVNLADGCDAWWVVKSPEDCDWDYNRWREEGLYRDHHSFVSTHILSYVLKSLEVEELKEKIEELKTRIPFNHLIV